MSSTRRVWPERQLPLPFPSRACRQLPRKAHGLPSSSANSGTDCSAPDCGCPVTSVPPRSAECITLTLFPGTAERLPTEWRSIIMADEGQVHAGITKRLAGVGSTDVTATDVTACPRYATTPSPSSRACSPPPHIFIAYFSIFCISPFIIYELTFIINLKHYCKLSWGNLTCLVPLNYYSRISNLHLLRHQLNVNKIIMN